MTKPERRATLVQRVRARVLRAAARIIVALPERPVDALAGSAGELWYRLAPDRASLARRNLPRVVRALPERDLGGRRVAVAAHDGAALERLLRATFRETARYYLDMVRLPSRKPEELDQRLRIETPDVVDRAFGPDAPAVLVALHFGAVEYPALLAVARSGGRIVAPMETLDDPAIQDWLEATRGSVGVDIVPLRDARRALLGALAEGRTVGLVADRNVAGGTVDVPFFGTPAPMPLGPALLAVESGRPIYIAGVRRLGRGRYAGRLTQVEVAVEGKRRDRITETAARVARVMEETVAVAPEQWWSLLAPIWPDLDARAATGTGHLEPEAAS